MHFSKLLLIFCSLIFSINAHAYFTDSQEENGIYYFLFSNPNKILRYDISNKQFLSEIEIELEKSATAFNIKNNDVYLAFGREIKKTDLNFNTYSFIQNTGDPVENLMVINNFLYAISGYTNLITTINLATLSKTETNSSQPYYSNKYYASKLSSSYYLSNQYNGIHIINLGLDGEQTSVVKQSSSYDSYTDQIFISPDESRALNYDGDIFDLSTLNSTGFISDNILNISYISDTSYIVHTDGFLHLYNESNIDTSQVSLINTPNIITNNGTNVFTFESNYNDISVRVIELSSFVTPQISTVTTESTPIFNSALTYFDQTDTVYLIDSTTLKMYRWSVSSQSYIDSILLSRIPKSLTYSKSHNRLYLGYLDGIINYIDLSQSSLSENFFSRIKNPLSDITSFENFIVAYNTSLFYSINASGKIIDKSPTYSYTSDIKYSNKVQLANQPNYIYSKGYNSNYNAKLNIDSITGEILNYERIYIADDTSSNLFGFNNKLVNTNGHILDSNDFSVMGYLSNNITDAIDINGVLYTVNLTDSSIQEWNSNYELVSSHKKTTYQAPKIFGINSNLLIVNDSTLPPSFTVYDTSVISDSDGDTIEDIWDNCISISNTSQRNFDNDEFGDSCDDDSDNDGLPDDFELSEGLNFLDSTDALLDLDLDGFNNIIEYKLNSKLNNPDDIPTVNFVSSFHNDFSSGIPNNFYFPSAKPWTLSSNNTTNILNSGHIISEPSSVGFVNFYEDGILSFKARSINTELSSEITIDGTSHIFYPTNNWKQFHYKLEKGFHIIEISVSKNSYFHLSNYVRLEIDNVHFEQDSDGDEIADSLDNCPDLINYSQNDNDADGLGNECDLDPNGIDIDTDGYGDSNDNCPLAYNPNQEDIDDDGLGDACDFVDNRPPDSDSDGIIDDNDNCIFYANSNQSDIDTDSIGDVCDDDIDNDGLSNIIEESYHFLDAYNTNDAYLDFDFDGATNLYEITLGNNPDNSDNYTTINLLEYVPLHEREYLYANEQYFAQFSIKNGQQENEFIIQTLPYSETTSLIRKNENGIYLIESIDYNNYKTIYSDALLMPAQMVIGDTIRFTVQAITLGYNNNSETISTNRSLYLKSTGTHSWKGKTYASITIEDESGENTVYLKGIGQLNYSGGLPLISIDELDRGLFEKTDDALNISSSTEETIGSMSWKMLFLFMLLLIYTRQAYSKNIVKKKIHNST